jgi:hypothetical protein
MNTTLSTAPDRRDNPLPPPLEYRPRRVAALDRLALHVGVALIKWGRRPRSGWGESRASRTEQRLALLARDPEFGNHLSRFAREHIEEYLVRREEDEERAARP